MGKPTVSQAIPAVCDAIWDAMGEEQMPEEGCREKWEKIEKGFRYRWQFPNCIGAIDGKHVIIQSPPLSESKFHNYKGTFSIVLLALVDHQYRFTHVDIGGFGSNSDGNIFNTSKFGQDYIAGRLNVPPPKAIPGDTLGRVVPHCILGDEAFPLRPDLMRPYPRHKNALLPRDQRVFNYRQSRGRRLSECAFGILVARWRIYGGRICLSDDNVDRVIKATCVLHNYLTADRPLEHLQEELGINTEEADMTYDTGCMLALQNLHGYHSSQESMGIRDVYKSYFNGDGAVDFQNPAVDRVHNQ